MGMTMAGAEPLRMIPIYTPTSLSDLLAARMSLDAAGIPYVVENENYAGLSGAALPYVGDAAVTIAVPATRSGEARALLDTSRRAEPSE